MGKDLNQRIIGAHVSIAGGLDTAIDRGEKLNCTAIQSFASSPRSTKYTELTEDKLKLYRQKRTLSHISWHIFHGIYLINLAHINPDYVQICVESLIYYQQLAEKIEGVGTVFHVGSHKGNGLSVYMDQITRALVRILAETPPGINLMLEMAAGQKGTIGRSIDELKMIFDAVEKAHGNTDALALGLDTQHAFASGYDIRTVTGVERLVDEVKIAVGIDRIKVIHVNDSAVPFNSGKDRHANIDKGDIGKKGLGGFINHPDLVKIPLILEVPGSGDGPRNADVDQLYSLVAHK